MTREEIEKTKWAKEFKKNYPDKYWDAICHAMRRRLLVGVVRESSEWNIYVESDFGFQMGTRKTKKAALALCREMGWKVKR